MCLILVDLNSFAVPLLLWIDCIIWTTLVIDYIAEVDLSPRSHLISNLRTDVRLQIKRISLFHFDKLSTSKDQK